MKIRIKGSKAAQQAEAAGLAPIEPKTIINHVKHVKSNDKLLYVILAAVIIDIIIGLVRLL